DPLAFAYDPATRTYTLTFRTRDNAEGPTEITVPADTYPGGYRVEVRGGKARWDGHAQTVTVSTHGRPGATYEVTISPR
ncbi:endoglycoceramidase, partial [Streptomyces sp. SID7760]|nr:endoglycoceramidase [Streptomyces sp. SID7760]